MSVSLTKLARKMGPRNWPRLAIGFIVLLGLVLLPFKGHPQSSFDFIYVDFGHTEQLNALKEKVKEVVKQRAGSFLVFVSNDFRPIVVTSEEQLEGDLNQINNLAPSKAYYWDEFQIIDSLFSQYSNIHGLSEDGLQSEYEVRFHFFLDASQSKMYSAEKYLIDELLLCNRILKVDGDKNERKLMKSNCTVLVYFQDSPDRKYIEKIHTKYGYEIANY